MKITTNGRGRSVGSSHAKKKKTDGWWPLLFIGPLMLGVVVFYHYPIVKNFYISFTQSGAFGNNVEWVGLQNCKNLFANSDFSSALMNNLIYVAAILLGIPLALVVSALLATPGLKGARIYRGMFFLPYIAMPVAVALVWKLLLNGDFGLVNQALSKFGVENPSYWLTTPGFALAAVCLFGVWASIGFNVIILSAGISGIPHELYEAASLDGAGKRQQFFSITVPLLAPSIFLLTVVQTISGFQLFDALFALMGTNNPALPHTKSLVYLFYSEAFTNNDKGMGAAVAVIILLIIGGVTAFQFHIRKKWIDQ